MTGVAHSSPSGLPLPACCDPHVFLWRRFLPSALAFIAQGALAGQPTLVHCNAGVSRSGAVVVEWLRRTEASVGGSVADALALAKSKRPIITPNSNFITQLNAIAASGDDGGAAAGGGEGGGASAGTSVGYAAEGRV